jgi:Relaxase/Mobilisation nuclease domain
MIPRIHKSASSNRLIEYLLQSGKQAQIVQTSLFTPTINTLVAGETVITDPVIRGTVSDELNQAFDRVNELRPRLKNNTMHLIIGFDSKDGEVSLELKGEIAKNIMDRMGFENTYWVAINHGRDDPEHDHIHDHDHMHILAPRVDFNGRTISDSWDFPKVQSILRDIEQSYELTPFVPFWEREYVTPEIHWMLIPHHEEEILQQQPRFKRSM